MSQPLTKVLLRFECRNLPNLDNLSLSDGQVWAFILDRQTNQWILLGTTEIIRNNLNPVFSETLRLDYFFETVQSLKFIVVDIDKPVQSLVGHTDIFGEVIVNLSDIVGGRSQSCSRAIQSKRQFSGLLIVRAEEVKDMRTNVQMSISCSNLDKKDFLGKSDPYLEIMKSRNGEWALVHRTEVIKKNLNPIWEPFLLDLSSMVDNGNINTLLRFQVFDWDDDGKSDFIGDFQCTIEHIKNGQVSWELVNEKKRKGNKKYKNSGILSFNRFDLTRQYSFMDYLVGGTQMNLIVAIDYTASNGDPRSPNSLHYLNPNGSLNQYAQVISSVGNILLSYDSDGRVPTYGFGAKLPDGNVSHCFHVNGTNNPEVVGVNGILQSYYNSFSHGVTLFGPTNFAPIINVAAQIAANLHRNNQDLQSYLILLIITDGEITDLPETTREIVNASGLPMSIVIVGVGTHDFAQMNFLDGDGGKLRSGNRYAERDMVQFVPYSLYAHDPNQLAAATLAEIPKQFLQYMIKNNVVPRPPLTQQEITVIETQQITTIMTNQ